MANLFTKLKDWIVNEWKELAPEEEAALESLEAKITPEALDLMEDAVTYAATLGLSDVEARAAAIAKFKTDAVTTIKDLETWAVSEYNLLLELVYNIVKKKLTTATSAASTTTATS